MKRYCLPELTKLRSRRSWRWRLVLVLRLLHEVGYLVILIVISRVSRLARLFIWGLSSPRTLSPLEVAATFRVDMGEWAIRSMLARVPSFHA